MSTMSTSIIAIRVLSSCCFFVVILLNHFRRVDAIRLCCSAQILFKKWRWPARISTSHSTTGSACWVSKSSATTRTDPAPCSATPRNRPSWNSRTLVRTGFVLLFFFCLEHVEFLPIFTVRVLGDGEFFFYLLSTSLISGWFWSNGVTLSLDRDSSGALQGFRPHRLLVPGLPVGVDRGAGQGRQRRHSDAADQPRHARKGHRSSRHPRRSCKKLVIPPSHPVSSLAFQRELLSFSQDFIQTVHQLILL